MQPWHEARWRRLLAPVGGGLLFLILTTFLSTRGLAEGVPPLAGFAAFVYAAVFGSLLAGAYALAGFGLGSMPVALLARGCPALAPARALWLQAPLGLGLMLSLSHLLGALGLLSGDGAITRCAAWTPVGLGLLLTLNQVVHGRLRPERWPLIPPSTILWVPPAALLLVAACNPPGWLWTSEHGAYDATSYHLQLPKEWISDPLDGGVGRIAPVPHNVYSYLPSYMEAACTHLGQLILYPRDACTPVERMLGGSTAPTASLEHDAFWVQACQILHALFALSAALTLARTCWVLIVDLDLTPASPVGRAAALLGASSAGAIVLATPWLVVVGSLAYNDAAMLALGSGAMLCAVERALPPIRRMAAAAFLVGVCASTKPTGLMMFAPTVALLALRGLPAAAAPLTLAVGALTGLATLSPWLIRNALADGNPVFPFFPELFGPGHWRPEQFARYHAAHTFAGPWFERLRTLFSERGLLHPQWAFWLPLVLASVVLPWANRSTRPAARPLVLGLAAMLAGWLALTHLQSRFLLPLLAPAGVLVGIGMSMLLAAAGARPGLTGRLATIAVIAAPLAMSLWLAPIFLGQRGGRPNELLARGVGGLTGSAFTAQFEEMPEEQREAFFQRAAGPSHFINLLITPRLMSLGDAPAAEPPNRVLLLGDAAALYFLSALGGQNAPVHAHTTWDASPLGDAIRAHPDDPARWTAALRDRGFGWVLTNFDELRRLIVIDGNYDSAVTMEALARWLGGPESPDPVRAWPPDLELSTPPPPAGTVLYRLAAGSDAPAVAPSRATGGSAP